MAAVLGYPDDPLHWNQTVGMTSLAGELDYFWQKETAGMYGDTAGGVAWGNVAPAANSMFPRDWVVTMAQEWMNDGVG